MTKKIKPFRSLKWVVIAYLITIILIAVYAAVLAYTKVPESTIPTCVLMISLLSILIASTLSVRKEKENGLMNGAFIGFSYIVILYLLSSFFITGFHLNTYALVTIVLCGLIGCIGGIVGVNH